MGMHLRHKTTPESQKTSNLFFDNPLFEDFAVRALSLDGCPLGEVSATVSQIEEGDREGWYEQWTATADRIAALGDESASADHAVSARDAYLRASSYYRTAYLPLYGSPIDARLVKAFDQETTVFQKAAAHMSPAVEPVEIPYEGTTLPGYFCQADDSGRPRPTLVCTNGYDSTINEMYIAFAGALPRGYNLLLFDGPGQGQPLIEQGLVFRPDWENVVTPVVDFALTWSEVDPEKVALLGWSFGGYLAPRAGSTARLPASPTPASGTSSKRTKPVCRRSPRRRSTNFPTSTRACWNRSWRRFGRTPSSAGASFSATSRCTGSTPC